MTIHSAPNSKGFCLLPHFQFVPWLGHTRPFYVTFFGLRNSLIPALVIERRGTDNKQLGSLDLSFNFWIATCFAPRCTEIRCFVQEALCKACRPASPQSNTMSVSRLDRLDDCVALP